MQMDDNTLCKSRQQTCLTDPLSEVVFIWWCHNKRTISAITRRQWWSARWASCSPTDVPHTFFVSGFISSGYPFPPLSWHWTLLFQLLLENSTSCDVLQNFIQNLIPWLVAFTLHSPHQLMWKSIWFNLGVSRSDINNSSCNNSLKWMIGLQGARGVHL